MIDNTYFVSTCPKPEGPESRTRLLVFIENTSDFSTLGIERD